VSRTSLSADEGQYRHPASVAGRHQRFGAPKCVRTDNEAVFTSRLFRLGLHLLGIRHQRTAPFAPWQNGRIERFFGTFKERFRIWLAQGTSALSRIEPPLLAKTEPLAPVRSGSRVAPPSDSLVDDG
jgi:transposase InsO family protein